MQSLKFSPELVPLVIDGSKSSTWRLFDEKNLQVGEIIDLIKRPELSVFAQAKITEVIQTKMGNLSSNEKQGHETYINDEEMYKTYSGYYNKPVSSETVVTIYRFELVK